MTTTTVELSQEEKRIKIAEACGWEDCCKGGELEENFKYFNTFEGCAAGLIPPQEVGQQWYEKLPDYFNDLNAIAQADTQAPQEYAAILRVIVAEAHHIKADDADCLSDNAFVKATAAQRAEAFGRVLSLW